MIGRGLLRLGASLKFAMMSSGQNFRRNMAVSLAAVSTMALILLIMGMTLLATHMLNQELNLQQARASDEKVFLGDGLSLTSMENLRLQLAHDPRITSATVETKDQAAAEYASRQTDFNTVVQTVLNGKNPLPPSVNVSVGKLKDLATVDSQVRAIPIVQSTDYNKDVIPKLEELITALQIIGLVAAAILAFISLVIIMSTIRTAVFIRGREIEIMKLVGAANWFVRGPFILEGVFGGILAALAAGVFILGGNRLLSAWHGGWGIVTWDPSYLLVLLLGLAAAGIGLGALGSLLGVRRFLAT